ncbi:4-hydroxybenzoate polyprenyltransferase [Desulfatibacillum alkenivorans DSM 16219]|uniref:4-hydroxybenzoate polyprenyltransferase n=1 Tax=Desulfatibacillum alkenivorans DSM 16219 TaxID=1121393 RepID=A0A1M6BT38_9BACT|nr:UbiA family prenyltransferase [Desulfatibacillum alkenivorans]SHI51851.1 4-hydroxybenzoate polyprenyltransferase [Desulfatibacillum alkenivorans DSM 16219]
MPAHAAPAQSPALGSRLGNAMQALFSVLNLFRVGGWVHFLGLYLLGAVYAAGKIPMTAAFYAGFGCCCAYLSFTYGYNNLFDRELDAPAKNPITAGRIPLNQARCLALSAGLAGWVLSWLVSVPAGLLATGMYLASWLYSGPVQVKRIFIAGSLTNCLIFIPIFTLGMVASGGTANGGLFMALVFCPSILIPQLAHEIQDRDSDLKAGVKTVAVKAGKNKTIGCMRLLALFRALLGWIGFWPGYLMAGDALLISAISVFEIGLMSLYSRERDLAQMRLFFRFSNIILGLGLLVLWVLRGGLEGVM